MFELFLVYIWLKISAISWTLIVSAVAVIIYAAFKLLKHADASMTSNKVLDGIARGETYHRKSEIEDAKTFKEGEVEAYKSVVKSSRRLAFLALMLIFVNVIMPSQKQLSVLVVSGYAIQVARSPEVEKIITLAKGVANNWLDEEINKLSKKKDDEPQEAKPEVKPTEK